MSALASPSYNNQPQQQNYDFSPLTQFQSDMMHQFVNIIFNYIVGLPTAQTSDAEAKLETFINDNNLKKAYETLFYQLVSVLHLSIKHQHSADYIEKMLTTTYGLSVENSAVIKKSYSHNVNIITQLFNENVFKISKLLDIEWRFGVTTSNSQLSQVGTCWLQLKIKKQQQSNNIDDNSNVKYDIIEMSLQQFYTFLTMLQQAAVEISSQ